MASTADSRMISATYHHRCVLVPEVVAICSLLCMGNRCTVLCCNTFDVSRERFLPGLSVLHGRTLCFWLAVPLCTRPDRWHSLG